MGVLFFSASPSNHRLALLRKFAESRTCALRKFAESPDLRFCASPPNHELAPRSGAQVHRIKDLRPLFARKFAESPDLRFCASSPNHGFALLRKFAESPDLRLCASPPNPGLAPLRAAPKGADRGCVWVLKRRRGSAWEGHPAGERELCGEGCRLNGQGVRAPGTSEGMRGGVVSRWEGSAGASLFSILVVPSARGSRQRE